ncbi:hypothetical protein ES705_42961 [subsurface metagenome]|jgi:imidazole glycerol phosphate synthase subunit HisF
MRAELLEKKEKSEREIRRLGRKALKERRNEEWLKELQATGVGEKLLEAISADTLDSIGKTYARQARKAQKTAEACFIMATAKRREATNGKN